VPARTRTDRRFPLTTVYGHSFAVLDMTAPPGGGRAALSPARDQA
jgi:hypothetical protein